MGVSVQPAVLPSKHSMEIFAEASIIWMAKSVIFFSPISATKIRFNQKVCGYTFIIYLLRSICVENVGKGDNRPN